MNETWFSIIEIVVPLIGAAIGYIMHTFNERIKALEDTGDKLSQDKLDKADYHRDQGAFQETLRSLQTDVKDLPEKIITLLTHLGLLNNGR